MSMTDLFHFIESGSLLQTLTDSVFVRSTVALVVNWRQHHEQLSTKIFKRVASFLREMSADNDFVSGLHSPELDSIVLNIVDSLTIENTDFACNLLAFHMNVCVSKFGAEKVLGEQYVPVVTKCFEKVVQLEGGVTPQEYFMQQFASQYKLADLKGGQKEESEEEDDEMIE